MLTIFNKWSQSPSVQLNAKYVDIKDEFRPKFLYTRTLYEALCFRPWIDCQLFLSQYREQLRNKKALKVQALFANSLPINLFLDFEHSKEIAKAIYVSACDQVAYFYDPDYDTVIECLPTCHSEEFPPK